MAELAFADSHCHLDDPKFQGEIDDVLSRARSAGGKLFVSIGCDLESSRTSVDLARRHANVCATVGLHPHDAELMTTEMLQSIEELARRPKVVAIGEIGLDYHYDNSGHQVQRSVFEQQLELARRISLPVVIHSRDSFGDTFDILAAADLPAHGRFAGILHCFSGTVDEARRGIELGFAISLAGPVTYPSANALRKTAAYVPADSLLVETDAPYLSPQPRRGKRNEPAFVIHTLERLALIRKTTLDLIAESTYQNTLSAYAIAAVAA